MATFNSIMRSVLGLNKKAQKIGPPTGGSNAWTWGPSSKFDKEISNEKLVDSSIVAAVLGWIVRTFPEAPLVVKKRTSTKDYEIVDDHAMSALIDSPNKFYSGVILWMATIVDWWVDGNAYWLKIRDGQFRVVQLWWIPSWMIEPKGPLDSRDTETFIDHYEYRPYPGANFKLLPEDVVHFRNGLDPFNLRKGLGKFKALFREIFTDEEASRFTAALLHNMGVPGLIVAPAKESTEYSPDSNEVKATKEYVKQGFGGDNRGETLVFKGPIEVHQFGFSPEQLNLRETRRIPEERVSGVVGVAAIVAGLGAGLDRSTFANYAEAREASYEENIIPTQRIIAADVKNQLLPDFESRIELFRVVFDTSDVRILQEDKNKESERLVAQWRAGIAFLSEVRSKLGYDVEAEMDVLALPLNADFVRKEDLAEYFAAEPEPEIPSPAPPGAPAPAPGQTEPGEGAPAGPRDGGTGQGGPGTPDGARARRLRALRGKAGSRRDVRYLQNIARQTAKLQTRFEGKLSTGYGKIGDKAGAIALALFDAPKGRKDDDEDEDEEIGGSALFRRFMTTPVDELDEGEDGGILQEIIDEILEEKGMKPTLDDVLNSWKTVWHGHYSNVAKVVYEETATYLEVDMVFEETSPGEIRILESGGKRLNSLDVPAHVSAEIRAALIEGRKRGDGPRQIARAIRAEVGSTSKATTIARTETKYAQNIASIEAYKKSEVVIGLRAFDNQTGYDDEDCTERDGKVYSFDEAETLTAEEHPNGTLSWAPVTGQR